MLIYWLKSDQILEHTITLPSSEHFYKFPSSYMYCGSSILIIWCLNLLELFVTESYSFSLSGVGEAGVLKRWAEGADRGAEEPEAAAGLHAQPSSTDMHRPSSQRPNSRRREEPLHPADQRDHAAVYELYHTRICESCHADRLRSSLKRETSEKILPRSAEGPAQGKKNKRKKTRVHCIGLRTQVSNMYKH